MTDISIYDYPEQLQEVRELLVVVKAIDSAKNRTAVAKSFEDPSREGWSHKNLDTLARQWAESGYNDLALLDRRKHQELQRAKAVGLPQEFLIWAGGMMLKNKRKSRPQHRAIIRQWEEWRKTGNPDYAIPGYDMAPPPGDRSRIPDGWSYSQLMKKAQPPVEELAIARIGTVAAKEFLPFIPGTREGIRFLEWVFCDDVEQDRNIVLPGYIDPMRLLQLGTLCYGSGVYLKFGLRPDLPKGDGTRERLKRRDFLFLVAHMLLEFGYPLDYKMHIVVERATATMTLAEAQFLYDISDGQILVGYTSMQGEFVVAWQEKASGNPDGKGPLESWHNLFHNEMAAIEGHVGKDRDHSPAALQGSDREVVALNKAALLLTPDQRRHLKLPYATFAQAHAETLQIVHRINRRRDHELEGFEHVMDWRVKGLPMDWQPEAALVTLDPAMRSRVEFLPRLETPIERMQRLSIGARFARPHPGAMVRFYEDSHSKTRIERRQAKATVENKIFWFGPTDPIDALPNGTEVHLHYAPINPEFALVTSGGKFVGMWPRQLAGRADADALAEGIRRKQSFLNHAMSSVRGKMLETLVEQDRRINSNLQLLEETGVLPSEAQHALSTPVALPVNEFSKVVTQAGDIVNGKARRQKTAEKTTREDRALAVKLLKSSTP